MEFLFDCEVLLLVELCLLPGLVVAVGQFGLHVLPHGEGQVVDGVLGKITALLRLHSSHFLLVVHPFVLQGVLRHFIFPSEPQDLVPEAANRIFEVAHLQLMVAFDLIQNL